MRFQVPQNLDVSDTIFFGLSFQQLFYIAGSLGWSIFVFLFLGGFLPAVLLGGPVVVFALLLSFFSFNTQPFIVILQSIFHFLFRKKIYVWKKTAVQYMPQRKGAAHEESSADDSLSGKRVNALRADLLFDSSEGMFGSDPDVDI